MQLLKEIRDKDLGIDPKEEVKYRLRMAARAVLLDKNNKIALLHVTKHHYHKLPGGGIEDEEQILAALQREIMEEAGCTLNVKENVGIIIEYRDEHEILQLSFCYLGNVKENSKKLDFTEKEISLGFELIWVDINEAIELLEKAEPTSYSGKFIIKRDLTFLKKAKELM
ncbi:MAG: NUDIX domain-containing protein [archaeon]